jgi:hypothetical protein
LAGACVDCAHDPVHSTEPGEVQGFLARVASPPFGTPGPSGGDPCWSPVDGDWRHAIE